MRCHREAYRAGLQFPDVTRPEIKVRGMALFVLTLYVRKTGKCHRGSGIELSQIVLGLMCPRGQSGGGESQNEAKSRRFGMDLPSRAFYEGVNPKTILNNCQRRSQKGQQGPQDHRQRPQDHRQGQQGLPAKVTERPAKATGPQAKDQQQPQTNSKGYGETDKRPAEASKGPQTAGKTG